jgi:hypothetical protein
VDASASHPGLAATTVGAITIGKAACTTCTAAATTATATAATAAAHATSIATAAIATSSRPADPAYSASAARVTEPEAVV